MNTKQKLLSITIISYVPDAAMERVTKLMGLSCWGIGQYHMDLQCREQMEPDLCNILYIL